MNKKLSRTLKNNHQKQLFHHCFINELETVSFFDPLEYLPLGWSGMMTKSQISSPQQYSCYQSCCAPSQLWRADHAAPVSSRKIRLRIGALDVKWWLVTNTKQIQKSLLLSNLSISWRPTFDHNGPLQTKYLPSSLTFIIGLCSQWFGLKNTFTPEYRMWNTPSSGLFQWPPTAASIPHVIRPASDLSQFADSTSSRIPQTKSDNGVASSTREVKNGLDGLYAASTTSTPATSNPSSWTMENTSKTQSW